MNIRPALLACVLLVSSAVAGTPALPGDSLYQLKIALTTQDGRSMRLDELRGQPVLISMFYASCGGVCPAIAFSMRQLEAKLRPAQRARLRPLLVSLDPVHDDPAALMEFARLNKLEGPRWIVARAPQSSVMELAAALGVRYRELPGGVFSHSTVIAVLDADGVIRARTEQLMELDPAVLAALAAATSAKARPPPDAGR
jgi:protein SCO1/2